MLEYRFTFQNKVYECIGEDRDFQIKQFRYAIEIGDWMTVKNRIINQLMWGPRLKEIK
jgi:hypothetical protein